MGFFLDFLRDFLSAKMFNFNFHQMEDLKIIRNQNGQNCLKMSVCQTRKSTFGYKKVDFFTFPSFLGTNSISDSHIFWLPRK